MVFKQTLYRHFRLLSYVVLVYLLIYFLVYQRTGLSIFSEPLIKITYIALLIDILPTIMLHLQYTYFSTGIVGKVDVDSQSIVYSEKNIRHTYSFADISQVTCHSSYGRKSYVLSFTGYAYCLVTFTDGRKLIIPNLIFPDVTDVLPELVKVEPTRKLSVYAFIF